MVKTYSAKASELNKEWVVIDATDMVVGRLASQIAMLLMGKHLPTYTPHMDGGMYVVVVNADKAHMTGNKLARKDGKIYYRHTGHPGGVKETTAGKIIEGRFPERVLIKAVQRMITRNTLGRQRMTHLFVYSGAEHPHAAQQPRLLDVASSNPKNVKRS
jgi:large subunit ribosomal protein L13